jgi:hypothetical protein
MGTAGVLLDERREDEGVLKPKGRSVCLVFGGESSEGATL